MSIYKLVGVDSALPWLLMLDQTVAQTLVFTPVKSPHVFLCSLKTKLYLRDRRFYMK